MQSTQLPSRVDLFAQLHVTRSLDDAELDEEESGCEC
jgi:hypothetical protein